MCVLWQQYRDQLYVIERVTNHWTIECQKHQQETSTCSIYIQYSLFDPEMYDCIKRCFALYAFPRIRVLMGDNDKRIALRMMLSRPCLIYRRPRHLLWPLLQTH